MCVCVYLHANQRERQLGVSTKWFVGQHPVALYCYDVRTPIRAVYLLIILLWKTLDRKPFPSGSTVPRREPNVQIRKIHDRKKVG